jgi:UDP-hydrolysing UDP-N-acetyl-D-glucosamine 2-epimerase
MLCDTPVCHIFGGDSITNYVTYDNNIRHCITKLSSLHFTANQDHKDRIIKMGEEEWRVFNTGSPAIDYINDCRYLSKNYLQNKFTKINFYKPYCVLTFHPVPTEFTFIEQQIMNVIKSLNEKDIQVVCTKPTNDIGNEIIINKIKGEGNLNSNFLLVDSISQEEYYSLLKYCSFVIGNSSSGVLETTSFKIPCINIGTRQTGRVREANVIDADYSINSIMKCIDKCLNDKKFLEICKECTNPYGDGQTSSRILEILDVVLADKKRLLIKKNTY